MKKDRLYDLGIVVMISQAIIWAFQGSSEVKKRQEAKSKETPKVPYVQVVSTNSVSPSMKLIEVKPVKPRKVVEEEDTAALDAQKKKVNENRSSER